MILFLLYTQIAVLLTGYRYLDDLTGQHTGTFYMRVLEEGTGVYSVFLLLPLIFRFARIYLYERKGWLRLGLFHLAAAVLFSSAHTTMMAISRHFLAPLIGSRSVRLRHHNLPLSHGVFERPCLVPPQSWDCIISTNA